MTCFFGTEGVCHDFMAASQAWHLVSNSVQLTEALSTTLMFRDGAREHAGHAAARA